MRKRNHHSFMNPSKIVGLIVIISVMFLTIGFSTESVDLGINDISAVVRVQKDIRISDVSLVSTNSSAISNWEDYNEKSVFSSISLPNSDSTVTYSIKVTNVGNEEAAISEITGLPNNLSYSINNYSLNAVLCDDLNPNQCTLGTTTTFTITVGYKSGGYDSTKTDYTINMDFSFVYKVDAVAKIGTTYYKTLKAAITAASDNTETTIVLLKNTNEIISIGSAKNVIINLNGKTLGNSNNNPVISNDGIAVIRNGRITSDAAQGAINNQGTITINDMVITMTGGKQALYNKGTATITGNSYLNATNDQRAAVQNLAGATLNVLSGTIESTGFSGLVNSGTLVMGTSDGTVNDTSPLIIGEDYGLSFPDNKGTLSFYDGIIKGKTAAISNESRITRFESGYGAIHEEETINSALYKVVYPGISSKVTFNPNGGTVSETTRYVGIGHKVGTLPIPVRSGREFIGWFTKSSGGVEIDQDTIIENNITFYAHWLKTSGVAQIGEELYDTLQEAITSVTDSTPTTIVLLKNASESLTVAAGKNITLDLGEKTLSNSGNTAVIENDGNLTITNGTITSNADTAAINQNSGNLTISSADIVATGTRQTMYITGGVVEITGNSYLSSQTYGKPTNTTMERGAIQCLPGGTLIITGGTIIGTRQQAVSNEGILIIGTKDGNINTSTPILIGEVHGVRNAGTFKFYDGIIKGVTDAIDGTIAEQEDNSQVINSTEVIDNKTYKTAYLQLSE